MDEYVDDLQVAAMMAMESLETQKPIHSMGDSVAQIAKSHGANSEVESKIGQSEHNRTLVQVANELHAAETKPSIVEYSESDDSDSDDSSSSDESDTESKNKERKENEVNEEGENSDLEEIETTSEPPRTVNELQYSARPVEPVIEPIADASIVVPIGHVLNVNKESNLVIIEGLSDTTALDEGSVLCLKLQQHSVDSANATSLRVVGKIDEVFGPVTNPMYIVRLRNEQLEGSNVCPDSNGNMEQQTTNQTDQTQENVQSDDDGKQLKGSETELNVLKAAQSSESTNSNSSIKYARVNELETGVAVFAVADYAKYVHADACRVKGSDASNRYDEEPPAEELEYSDDEEEARAKSSRRKRKVKTKTFSQGNNNNTCTPDFAAAAAAAGMPGMVQPNMYPSHSHNMPHQQFASSNMPNASIPTYQQQAAMLQQMQVQMQTMQAQLAAYQNQQQMTQPMSRLPQQPAQSYPHVHQQQYQQQQHQQQQHQLQQHQHHQQQQQINEANRQAANAFATGSFSLFGSQLGSGAQQQ